jgi:hypothetical protein
MKSMTKKQFEIIDAVVKQRFISVLFELYEIKQGLSKFKQDAVFGEFPGYNTNGMNAYVHDGYVNVIDGSLVITDKGEQLLADYIGAHTVMDAHTRYQFLKEDIPRNVRVYIAQSVFGLYTFGMATTDFDKCDEDCAMNNSRVPYSWDQIDRMTFIKLIKYFSEDVTSTFPLVDDGQGYYFSDLGEKDLTLQDEAEDAEKEK